MKTINTVVVREGAETAMPQHHYEPESPDYEGGGAECPECDGKKVTPDGDKCPHCDGTGQIDENGNPCYPDDD